MDDNDDDWDGTERYNDGEYTFDHVFMLQKLSQIYTEFPSFQRVFHYVPTQTQYPDDDCRRYLIYS